MTTVTYPKKRTATVRLDDFNKGVDSRKDGSLMTTRAADCFNFRQVRGVLEDGFGIKEFSVPTVGGKVVPETDGKRIKKVFFYKKYDQSEAEYDNRLVVWCESGKLFELKLNGGAEFELLDKTIEGAPCAVNYKLNGEDVLLFSDGEHIVVYDGENFNSYSAPEMTSMCLHNERLFATTGGEMTSLWFSDNFDPTNWYVSLEEAGFIDFQDGLGKVNKAVEHGGYVYVFRDLGITRVKGYFDQQEFYAENVTAPRDRIIPSTVTDCGKTLIYLTENGFYSFGGGSAKRIMTGIDELIKGVDNDDAVGAYHNGTFYCSLSVRTGKRTTKRVIAYDVDDGSYYFFKGGDIVDMLPIVSGDKSTLLFVAEGFYCLGELTDKSRFFSSALVKRWVNNEGDFGLAGEKTVTKITLKTLSDVTVTIGSDYGKRTVFVHASPHAQVVPIGLKGKDFSISFESKAFGAKISSVSLTVNY